MSDLENGHLVDLLSQPHKDQELLLQLLQEKNGNIPQLFPRAEYSWMTQLILGPVEELLFTPFVQPHQTSKLKPLNLTFQHNSYIENIVFKTTNPHGKLQVNPVFACNAAFVDHEITLHVQDDAFDQTEKESAKSCFLAHSIQSRPMKRSPTK